MIAYHGDPTIRDKYIARVRAHRLADELIQGTGFEHGKGCAVGCTLDDYNHVRYPIELGVPLHLAHLEDALFELLDLKNAMTWPERFLTAIRPGADLSGVWAQWAIWALTDPEHGVIRYVVGFPDVEAAILRVATRWRIGGTPEEFVDDAAAGLVAAGVRSPHLRERTLGAEWLAAEAAWTVACSSESPAMAARAADAAAHVAAAAEVTGNAREARVEWARVACDKVISLLVGAP
jgi:hypothetical protein